MADRAPVAQVGGGADGRTVLTRILVTGASGLLGANLVLDWAADHQVIAISRSRRFQLSGVTSLASDLRLPSCVESLVRARPEVIVHCMAETRVDWAEQHPDETWQSNVEATRHVAQACRETAAHLVHMSTDSVFDGTNAPYAESDPPNPLNAYARSKAQAEEEARRVPGAAIVRCAIYGWNAQDKSSLAEWGLARLQQGLRVPGYVDAWFSPILANDLGKVMLAIIERRLRGTFHAGSRDATTKAAFLRGVATRFGHDPSMVDDTVVTQGPDGARRPLDLRLDVSRTEQALGFQLPTVDEGLDRFHDLARHGYVARLRAILRGE